MNIPFFIAQSAAESAGASEWFSSGLSILVVILFFGFCIFIHELGHFLAARWRGLHIIAFSIGFKKIWSFKWNGVEYRIGCLPFGGYVDLPQVDSSEETPRDENGNALPPAKPFDRMIVAFAGPLCNILFGLLLAVPIWFHGLIDDTPRMNEITVNEIDANSNEYAAGLRNGDCITAVNGKKFHGTWNDFATLILFHNGETALSVTRPDGADTVLTYLPAPNEARMNKSYPFFTPVIPATVFPLSDSPAARGGLRDADVIVAMSINGGAEMPILRRGDVMEKLALADVFSDTVEVKVKIKRNGAELPEPFRIEAVRNTLSYEPGFELEAEYVATVQSAPANALLQAGDKILLVDGGFVRPYAHIEPLLQPDTQVLARRLTVLRDSTVLELNTDLANGSYTVGALSCVLDYEIAYRIAKVLPGSDADKQGMKKGMLFFDPDFQSRYRNGFPTGEAAHFTLIDPVQKTTRAVAVVPNTPYQIGVLLRWIRYPSPLDQLTSTISLTAKTLKGLFSRHSNISINDMSGPINIINIVQKVSRRDVWSALNLIVMISFSLGIFNLLPVPVLDGGHITLAGIQMVTGRPIPSKILRPVMTLFFFMLIGLMIYITGNDIFKVSGEFRDNGPQPFKILVLPKG